MFIIFPIVNIYSDDEGRNGYQSGGGRGSNNFDGQSAADFWDDFNINDPQSVYVDKYSQQEEIGGVGNYHRLNQNTCMLPISKSIPMKGSNVIMIICRRGF